VCVITRKADDVVVSISLIPGLARLMNDRLQGGQYVLFCEDCARKAGLESSFENSIIGVIAGQGVCCQGCDRDIGGRDVYLPDKRLKFKWIAK